jgi:hypothetical protein
VISQMPAGGPAEWPEGPSAQPVRSGTVPPLADGFSTQAATGYLASTGPAGGPGARDALLVLERTGLLDG